MCSSKFMGQERRISMVMGLPSGTPKTGCIQVTLGVVLLLVFAVELGFVWRTLTLKPTGCEWLVLLPNNVMVTGLTCSSVCKCFLKVFRLPSTHTCGTHSV